MGLGLSVLFGNFKKTVGRQLWSGLLQLLTVVFIARAYGPLGNGLYTIALMLPTMLALLLGVGLAPANIYYIASGQFAPKAVALTTGKLWLWLSFAGIVLGGIAITFWGHDWFPGVPTHTLILALGSFAPLLLITLAGSIFQGLQNFSLYNLTLSVPPALILAGVLICDALGLTASYLVIAHLVGTVVSAVVVVAALSRVMRAHWGANVQSPYRVSIALSYGLKSHLSNILAFVNYRIDLFLVNFYINPAAAGIYGVAIQIAEKLWLVSQAVSTVLLPRLSEVGADRSKAVAITSMLTRVTFTCTLILAILAGALGSKLISIIFGQPFSDAFVPFLLLLPGVIFGSCVRILACEISARGRPEINLYMAISIVAVSVACNVILIPRLGVYGAALSTTIAYSVNLALRIFMFKRMTGQGARAILVPRRGDWVMLLRSFPKVQVPKV